MIWALKPAEKGKAAVAKGRGGPIQISYEVHGNGPTKLVVGIAYSHRSPMIMKITLHSSVTSILKIKFLFSISSTRLLCPKLFPCDLIKRVVDYGFSGL